jgi:glutamate--cysteine ligase catalytic subunit
MFKSDSVFRDKHTPSPYVETFLYNGPGEGAHAAKPDHVYLDAMGFGMGCCCLQV